jgi:hypothetical protein
METLRELVSHGSMTLDNILNKFLEILTTQKHIHFFSVYFLEILSSWNHWRRWFALAPSHCQPHRPMMSSPTILIPCHVNGNHWVALVHRIFNDRVYFFYVDDLNSDATEYTIKNLLATTADRTFYPPTAYWIKCHSITYHPHSNECSPRTLMALMVKGLHLDLNKNILLPYLSGNSAQILRT